MQLPGGNVRSQVQLGNEEEVQLGNEEGRADEAEESKSAETADRRFDVQRLRSEKNLLGRSLCFLLHP